MKKILLGVLVLAFGMCLLAGCATAPLNERIASGKEFSARPGDLYDPNKPIEEQCVLINLAGRDLDIGDIDGKSPRNYLGVGMPLSSRSICVLQPGTHSVGWFYSGNKIMLQSFGNISFAFEAGQYYLFNGEESYEYKDVISCRIESIADHEQLSTSGSFAIASSEAVIEGINAALIKAKMK